jgi:hypothetical protein
MMRRISLWLGLVLAAAAGIAAAKVDSSRQSFAPPPGRLILAYRGFNDFLNSERSLENYQRLVVEPYPVVKRLHDLFAEWGRWDPNNFPKLIFDMPEQKVRTLLTGVKEEDLRALYDSLLSTAHNELPPRAPIDVGFYFTFFGDCQAFSVSGTETVAISLKYPMDLMPKILAHEYAHCLHNQRRPQENSSLGRSIVSEGFACYFLKRVSDESTVYDALWMMPKKAVDWCAAHEDTIKAVMAAEWTGGNAQAQKRFINGGYLASPPSGIPEKTGYYVGYRIVETCLNKGMLLEELCGQGSQVVIDGSGFFAK